MKLTKDEFAILLRSAEGDWNTVAPLAKLLMIRDHADVPIADVLGTYPELVPHIIPEALVEKLGLSAGLEEQLRLVENTFGPPPASSLLEEYSESSFPEALVPLCESIEEFHSEYSSASLAIGRDQAVFAPLTEEMLSDKLKRPVWKYEEFALYSQSYVMRPRKKLPEELGPIGRESKRRVAMMIEANTLPVGHRGHLPATTSPDDLINWAVQGNRFVLSDRLLKHAGEPSREQLIEQLANARASIDELDRTLKKKASSGPTVENKELRRLCIGLAGAIRRRHLATDKPLYDPDAKRSDFVPTLRRSIADILDPTDQLDEDTIRKYLRNSFKNLSAASKSRWRDFSETA